MIEYDPHECFGVGLLFKLAGSVIPRNLAKVAATRTHTMFLSALYHTVHMVTPCTLSQQTELAVARCLFWLP